MVFVRHFYSLVDQMFLDRFLSGEARVLFDTIGDTSGGLVADAQTRNQILVTLNVFPTQIIQQTTTFVHQCNQSTTSREIGWMLFQMFGQIRDAFGHTSNLVFWTAGVSFVPSMFLTQFRDTQLRDSPFGWLTVVFNTDAFGIGFKFPHIDNVIVRGRRINVRKVFIVVILLLFQRTQRPEPLILPSDLGYLCVCVCVCGEVGKDARMLKCDVSEKSANLEIGKMPQLDKAAIDPSHLQ